MIPQITKKRTITFCLPDGSEFSWTAKADIRTARYYEEEDLLLVILEKGEQQWLIGLTLQAEQIFKVKPPENWSFYYLSKHININTAVVCISELERFDWFFGIDPKDGALESLNRAY